MEDFVSRKNARPGAAANGFHEDAVTVVIVKEEDVIVAAGGCNNKFPSFLVGVDLPLRIGRARRSRDECKHWRGYRLEGKRRLQLRRPRCQAMVKGRRQFWAVWTAGFCALDLNDL